MRAPWTARRSSQSVLAEINPEYSLEGLMLKLKLQSFDHMMRRADSLEKTLMLGKTAGKRRGGGLAEDEMFRSYYQLNGHEFEQTPRDNEGQGSLACCSPWGHKVRQDFETEQQRQIKGMFSLVNSEFKEQ